MKKNTCILLTIWIGLLCLSAGTAWADPSLPITKPPVVPLTQLTGPPVDANAAQGQWFINPGMVQTCRSNEFYDNILGGSGGANAIYGYVNSITYDGGVPGNPILAFTILATISNDTTSTQSDWAYGDNSHGETNTFQNDAYQGALVDTKLTADFAITDQTNLPALFTPPYIDYYPYIEAMNEDQAAWYCWNPEDDDPEHTQVGAFFVPTWDFGTIPEGQWVTRKLSFVIQSPGLQPADSRYSVIVSSREEKSDILLNRSTSLKISTWIEGIDLDTGIPYPESPRRSSDVSVFHNRWIGEEPELDYGDAPDIPYPTLLANDGARHLIKSGVTMGPLIDAELDGQPTAAADGDDITALDDEDGVVFSTPLQLSSSATVAVTFSVDGYLSAWIDFNGNGSWTDAGENIYSSLAVTAGVNNLTFAVPGSPAGVAGITYARFRFTTWTLPLSPKGLAPDGEIEDYLVEITESEEEFDFGDAYDDGTGTTYPTLLANNGARHLLVSGVFMGALIDTEADGQPTFSADGDNLNNLDDEDGVVIPSVLYAGASTQVIVVASVDGFLDAWIDWNSNASWADTGEQVFNQQSVSAGINYLPLTVPMPPTLVAGGPHSRWRFSSAPTAVPSYIGAYTDGEVEDYEVMLKSVDFGDAPDPYPSLLSADGARHDTTAAPTYFLGAVIPDVEPDGIPEADALGDDLDNTADEDGVILVGSLVLGSNITINVTASASSILNAWIDFNRDGDWADTGEQIATDAMMISGGNSLGVFVPLGASPGQTFARFRLSSAAGLSYTGSASDGEVEDYSFIIYQDGPSDTNALVFTNILTLSTNEEQVWWTAETSVVYQVQYVTNLVDPAPLSWSNVGGYVVGPTNDQTDSNATDRMHFYRVIAPFSPPPP